jgi:hypothetical protein
VQTGLAWLEQLAALSAASKEGPAAADGLRFVYRDPQSGEDYRRIPMPRPETLDRALQTIGALVNRFNR